MDIRLKAAGSVAGTLAICFTIIWAINYFFPQQALIIMSLGLLGWLSWLMYGVRLSQMQWEQDKNSTKD
jgi:hypothetical protein